MSNPNPGTPTRTAPTASETLARFDADLVAFAVAVDACAECAEWRARKHPIQHFCDDHSRALRGIHARRDDADRARWREDALQDAYDAGLRDGAEREKATWAAVTQEQQRIAVTYLEADADSIDPPESEDEAIAAADRAALRAVAAAIRARGGT